jgi:biopolymer transport protein ExbD
MKLSKLQKRKALGVNMTPMIDIVFLLLIFFMTCTQVSEANRQQLQLPKQRGTEDQANAEVIINVDEQGNLAVGAEPATVPDVVAICLEEARRLHGGDASALKITFRIDRRADCSRVNELVEALTKIKVHTVRMAVQTGD